MKVLNSHAPLKRKFLRANHAPSTSKTLRKAILKRSYLIKIYFKKRTDNSLKPYMKRKNYCNHLYKKKEKRKPWTKDKTSWKKRVATNDQEIANELSTIFKNTAWSLVIIEIPYIINQVSGDILDLAEKCINKYQLNPSILLIKNRFNIQNLFSFHAIERNDMMRKLLNIDPKKQLLGTASDPKRWN